VIIGRWARLALPWINEAGCRFGFASGWLMLVMKKARFEEAGFA
jgi:hypothetical protein